MAQNKGISGARIFYRSYETGWGRAQRYGVPIGGIHGDKQTTGLASWPVAMVV